MIFLTFSIFFIVNGAEAELKGDCYLEGVTVENWSTAYTNQAVNDNEKIVFKTFNTANVTGVTVSGEDYSKYFFSKYEQNVVTIGPSAEFANFEKKEKNEENPTMVVNLDFDCNSGKGTLAFYQEIADLNTYEPAFSKSSYSYKLPMPLPADFNLQCLMDAPIEACDTDITNTKLNFAINPPGDFLVSSSGPTDDSKKCYNVLIKTEKPLTLSQTTSYDLVVTDIGNPTKNSKVEMKIEIDEQTAVPSNPQFNLAYYTAIYDNTAEQHTIKVDSIISLEKKDQAATVNIFGDHKDNFDININNNVITVTLKKNLEDEIISENVIVVLTLEAIVTNAEGPGRTALIIYMPKKECPTTTTSIPTTACPTTETPTECPICTTEATTIVTCPPCTTETPISTTACPTAETTTDCPVCTTEASTILTCPTDAPITTASLTTECPVCSTESTSIFSCPTETAATCPTTECPTEGTTISSCPTCAPETSTCSTTECPVCPTECTTVSSCPTCAPETSTCPTTECPVCPTECTTISSCPTCAPETSTCPVCPTEGTTVLSCPTCAPETSTCPTTECPVCPTECTTISSCPPCSTEASTCPTTECLVCPTECTTISNCPTYAPETSTCPVCPTEGTTVSSCPTCAPETSTCPTTECTVCPTEGTIISSCPTCAPETSTCPTTECPVCATCTTEVSSVTTFSVTESHASTTLSSTVPITTSFSSDCPPCITTITPAEPRVIFFQDLYSFHTVPENQITVGAVKAVAIPDEKIEYSIQKDGENVIPSQLEINKNSGILSLNGKVDVGVYKILAEAKGINTGASNTAHVEISVYIETETADVLIVKTIDEDAKSTLPLPCPLGQNTCTYQLISQYPETSEVLFQYDNGNLITEAINLQMEEIKDYLNPQFTLNFKLTDVENTYIFAPNKSVKEENDRHWLYLPKSIPRDPSTLLVSVVVKDVNNHPPVFDVGNKLTVGYPIKSLINELSPPYLVQVHATDLDKGVYADIRFTTTDKDFIVHPKTGIIYPGDNAFDNNINRQFSVIATDMDGASGGLTASLDIDVKLLTQQHLTFLTIQDKLIEDLDNVLKELSIKTNLKINYLTAAIVPKEQSKSLRNRSRLLRSTRDDEDYAIKLIVYALDGSNELVQTETLQEKLDDVEDVGDLSTTTWDSTCNEGSDTDVTNLTGYIVGIAVLASLLVIFIIAVGVTYYVKIVKKRTPKPYTEMRDEDSKSIKSENSQQDDDVNVSKRRPTGFVFNPPPVEEDNDSIGNDRKYESISNNGWADPSTSSTYNDPIQIKQNIYNDEHKLQITHDSVDHINDEDSRDSPNSLDYDNPKKSVSFRPIVEKINIVVDTDKADTDDVDVHL